MSLVEYEKLVTGGALPLAHNDQDLVLGEARLRCATRARDDIEGIRLAWSAERHLGEEGACRQVTKTTVSVRIGRRGGDDLRALLERDDDPGAWRSVCRCRWAAIGVGEHATADGHAAASVPLHGGARTDAV